jgi:hypothetical protein
MRSRHPVPLLIPALVTLLLAAPAWHAAPAPDPDPDRPAREKFEALKKKLPDLVATWPKDSGRWYSDARMELKLARRTGPVEAKVTMFCQHFSQGQPDPNSDQLLTVYLHYHDGAWTTTRFEGTWFPDNHFANRGARFLMLAIDELGEK